MKKYLFPILFCFMGNCIMAAPKKISLTKPTSPDPVKKIVKAIAKANVYELRAVNNIAKPATQQSLRFQDLLKVATVENLTKLATKNKNAVVRLYAYKALINKLKDIPIDVVHQFNNDTTLVHTLEGDTAGQVPLNSIAKGLLY
ncbi:MAG: hypothetical protein ABIR03_04540 [Ginsengibacter sp.]